MNKNSRTIYTTGQGRVANRSETPRRSGKTHSSPKRDGIVRVSRETKGRKGAGVSIVTGVPLNSDELKDLARELKGKCGSGGTILGETIEIQGDHRDKLVELLSEKGWTVKRAGG